MRKLVLGIIALVTVQFAFVTYTMLLSSSAEPIDEVAMLRPLPAASHHIASTAETVTESETVAPPKQQRRNGAIAPAKRVASTEIRAAKPAFMPAPSEPASSSEFENVVIRYNRNPNDSDCEFRGFPKSKKRSYIAKAGPAIKKPWDWLKAIGSKLN
ncbi:MAG: hypothetical protein DMF63_18350 [Acidobacteria bacterium]|nr:MAG: hypothetical protein DMF63_18350 [Acidobacteriota bacterium]